jgi:anhydro-N-acetylmuramic acid kinase
MSGQERLIAGAMSGTSADGVDVAITAIIGRGIEMSAKLIAHHHVPYDPSLKQLIFTTRSEGTISLENLAKMGRQISLAYVEAIRQSLAVSRLNASDLSAIAAHGQTLFHSPPNTIQWLDPTLIAAEIGCQVISDFRRADCAAGGQGAPLVPFADYILFRHPTKNRVLLNIGGIANLTSLPAGCSINEVTAFDTGPGNCVIDHVCRKANPTGPGYDPQGQLSRKSLPSREALQQLLAQPFFEKLPPKSTDAPAMIEMFESIREMRNATFDLRVSTATLFAIASIELAIAAMVPGQPDELIVSGGGVRNLVLMHHLRTWFKGEVKTIDEFGVPAEAKEAVAFALLGAATLDHLPSNILSVTGAKHAVVLGSITPKP